MTGFMARDPFHQGLAPNPSLAGEAGSIHPNSPAQDVFGAHQ